MQLPSLAAGFRCKLMWAACCGFVQSKTKLQGVIRPAVAGFQASQGFEIYFMHLLGCVCGGFYFFFFLPVLFSVTFMY